MTGLNLFFLVLRALLTGAGGRIMHGYGDSRTGQRYEAC